MHSEVNLAGSRNPFVSGNAQMNTSSNTNFKFYGKKNTLLSSECDKDSATPFMNHTPREMKDRRSLRTGHELIKAGKGSKPVIARDDFNSM